jgi:hypothetical protein
MFSKAVVTLFWWCFRQINTNAPSNNNPPSAAPTPIPALAPIESPELLRAGFSLALMVVVLLLLKAVPVRSPTPFGPIAVMLVMVLSKFAFASKTYEYK